MVHSGTKVVHGRAEIGAREALRIHLRTRLVQDYTPVMHMGAELITSVKEPRSPFTQMVQRDTTMVHGERHSLPLLAIIARQRRTASVLVATRSKQSRTPPVRSLTRKLQSRIERRQRVTDTRQGATPLWKQRTPLVGPSTRFIQSRTPPITAITERNEGET